MPQKIAHRAGSVRVEREIATFGVAGQDACSFKRSADAFGYPFHERLELRRARRRDPAKHRRLGTGEVRYASATAVNDAARDLLGDFRLFKVLYVGDWDPSGIHMSEVDLPERIERYGGDITIGRIAIMRHDLRKLPCFPAEDKRTDARYRWFKKTIRTSAASWTRCYRPRCGSVSGSSFARTSMMTCGSARSKSSASSASRWRHLANRGSLSSRRGKGDDEK